MPRRCGDDLTLAALPDAMMMTIRILGGPPRRRLTHAICLDTLRTDTSAEVFLEMLWLDSLTGELRRRELVSRHIHTDSRSAACDGMPTDL